MILKPFKRCFDEKFLFFSFLLTLFCCFDSSCPQNNNSYSVFFPSFIFFSIACRFITSMNAGSTEAKASPKHLEWADRIKQHHHQLQLAWRGASPGAEGSSQGSPNKDELRRWNQVVSGVGQKREREAYAEAMYRLATEYWDTPSGEAPRVKGKRGSKVRYDDRISLCLGCLSSYYAGVLTEKKGKEEAEKPLLFKTIPRILVRQSKALRVAFYNAHQRMATVQEVEHLLLGIPLPSADACPFPSVCTVHGKQLSPISALTVPPLEGPQRDEVAEVRVYDQVWGTAFATVQRYIQRLLQERLTDRMKASAKEDCPLHVLDVGSCYGPFRTKRLSPHIPLIVTSLDLEPHCPSTGDLSPVIAADWLTAEIAFTTEPFESTTDDSVQIQDGGRVEVTIEHPSGAGACGRYRLVRLAAASYDAVVFCLLLSYLPSPSLRYLACLHAFLVLKEGGMLVVLSTRTQGSRQVPWVQEWSEAIESAGFIREHVQTREKVVVLAFRKSSARLQKALLPQPTPDGAVDDALPSKEVVGQWKRVMLDTPVAKEGLKVTADHVL